MTVPSNENTRKKSPEASANPYKGDVSLQSLAERITNVVLSYSPPVTLGANTHAAFRVPRAASSSHNANHRNSSQASTGGRQVAQDRSGNSFSAHSTMYTFANYQEKQTKPLQF